MLRRTPLKRGKPLRKASKKHAANLRVYYSKRKLFLTAHPFCVAGPLFVAKEIPAGDECSVMASDVHHTRRRGAFLSVEATWLPVCRACHNWIEAHAQTARELGLLR